MVNLSEIKQKSKAKVKASIYRPSEEEKEKVSHDKNRWEKKEKNV